MQQASLGEQELELLRFITEQGPLTAGVVAEQYGVAHGLARTTIHTVLERLRKKGYLVREKREGAYHYAARVQTTELLTAQVRRFMQRTLGGSLKPIAAYLAGADDLREDELEELKAVVAQLDARSKGDEYDPA